MREPNKKFKQLRLQDLLHTVLNTAIFIGLYNAKLTEVESIIHLDNNVVRVDIKILIKITGKCKVTLCTDDLLNFIYISLNTMVHKTSWRQNKYNYISKSKHQGSLFSQTKLNTSDSKIQIN